MKSKKINKKLSLNKKTISNLEIDEMKVLHGGDDTVTLVTCMTNCRTVCKTCNVTACYC